MIKQNQISIFVFLCVLVIVFWHPVLSNNNFFYDDWGFIEKFQSNAVSLGYFFAPHNEHFMPIFKGLFFALFRLFGSNIVPYISLLMIAHIINVCLFFYLCLLIFKGRLWQALAATIFFATSSTYFEVLHWFIQLCSAMSLIALQISLIFLHKYSQNNKRPYLWASVASSFFMPMNFSLGLMGFIMLPIYYLAVIKRSFKMEAIRNAVKTLLPYFVSLLLFLLLYAIFVVPGLAAAREGKTITSFSRPFEALFAEFFGFLLKTLGLGMIMHPLNIWVGGFLLFNLILFGSFWALYLLLNKKHERVSLLNDKRLAMFCLFGAFLAWGTIAVSRTDLKEIASFMDWGRYHYFPAFFLSIFLGNVFPAFFRVFSKLFNPRRFLIYCVILFLLYLTGQWVMIREKANSGVRLEGSIHTCGHA